MDNLKKLICLTITEQDCAMELIIYAKSIYLQFNNLPGILHEWIIIIKRRCMLPIITSGVKESGN